MFRRRDKLTLSQRIRGFIWPRAGWWRSSKYVVYRVRRLPGSPSRIALGFACGAFVSFTPLFGLHYLLAMSAAWLLRGSLVAAFLGANLGWFYPFVLIWAYHIGTKIIGASGRLWIPADAGAGYMLQHPWDAFFPAMIGSLPVATALSVVAFLFAYWVIMAYRNIRRRRISQFVRPRPAPVLKETPP